MGKEAILVQIRLLGGVEAVGDDGAPIDVGSAKSQALLAALALSAGSAVPVSRLIDLVWDSEPPRTADKTLQSYVTRLRKGIGQDAITRVGAAYRLDVEPESVDVQRFQRLLDEGDVDGALAEWRGTPLVGLEADGFAATVDGLVEQWLGAVEANLEERLASEGTEPAGMSPHIGALTELTSAYPFREGLWALLMTALYRAGRQADALAAFRRAREHLVEKLGVEPGHRLRELESSILGHDERLRVDRALPGGGRGLPTGTVTFGFSDVEDSSALWALDPDAMAASMSRHDDLVHRTAAGHAGHVFATGGDSFGLAFHRAGDAMSWAEELQTAVSAESWAGAAKIRLRVGLHTGETDERGKGYFGPAVIVAARLAAAGHGGQTLISGVTAGLLDDRRLRDLGSFRLDGVVNEQRVFQLGDEEFPPLQIEARRRGNLPHRLDRLIGRTAEVRAIEDALLKSAVVTLVGPGGIGKTRLALAAGRRYDAEPGSGAWLVELANITSSDSVARAVAETLEVQEGPGRSLTESIVNSLRPRRMLLILDNCEHVVDGAADLARAVTEGCPDVRVLATSREGLGLGAEQLIAVSPLEPTGAAVDLFIERARSLTDSFDGHAERDTVEEICRRLDGVPLAIELAAARVRSLTPTDLVERLDDRLRLLTGGRRTSVERHRTLRATIQWSFDLLTASEQVLFRRLSIFAGPFDLRAAEAVAVDDQHLAVIDVDDLLGGLVDRSMVIVESGPFGRRFRLLETMRQFGAEHLQESEETDVVAGRHARWCLEEVTSNRLLLAGPAEVEGVLRLNELWPNLRAAFEFACATGDHRLGVSLLRPIAPEIYLRSQSEIGDWAEQLLEVASPEDEETVVFGITWAARRYMRTLDLGGYQRLVDRFGEPARPGIRYARAFIESDRGAMVDAAMAASADLEREGDRYAIDLFEVAAVALSHLTAGNYELVEELCTAQVERFQAGGPPSCLNWALTNLGFVATLQGRHAESMDYFLESAAVEVPPRTHSFRNPLEARAELRRGQVGRALERLGDYVEDLLDNDNMYLAVTACGEFIHMMLELDRVAETAAVLGYLNRTSYRPPLLYDVVAEAAQRLAREPEGAHDEEVRRGASMNGRSMLQFLRETLVRLSEDR